MITCQVQLDEEKKIRIPDHILQQLELKPNQVFDIYIDLLSVNQDFYEQLIVNLIHEGIIIEADV